MKRKRAASKSKGESEEGRLERWIDGKKRSTIEEALDDGRYGPPVVRGTDGEIKGRAEKLRLQHNWGPGKDILVELAMLCTHDNKEERKTFGYVAIALRELQNIMLDYQLRRDEEETENAIDGLGEYLRQKVKEGLETEEEAQTNENSTQLFSR